MHLSTKLATLSLLLLAACPRRDADGDLDDAERASDSTALSQGEAALLSSVADGAASPTAEGVATYIATHAPQRFQPAGCATATQVGASVTLVFAGCTGPRGLRAIEGTLAIATTATTVTAAATDFQLGRTILDLDTVATLGASALEVSTTSSGTGPLGNEIVHDGAYSLSWTATCVSLEGAWSTAGTDRGRATSADLTRCLDECPSGQLARTTVDGRTIEVAYDGTAVARWTTSRGRSGTFALACGL